MSAHQPTVLIVDDREENRYTLRHTLVRAGYLTVEAATGAEGLEKSRLGPDMIVLDVRLPDILGYEVCRRLKLNPQTRHIPVLQLSAALVSTESKLYALESGADAYLVQPVDPLILVATVRSLVRMHAAEKQAQAAAQQWAATFDALSEGVAVVRAGVITRCNRAMTHLLGLAYGEVEGQPFEGFLRTHFALEDGLGGRPELQPPVDVHVRQRFFRVCTTELAPEQGMAGSILIVADTTPERRAEEALLLNERLAATGRIAHTIAHEINNPLEAITNLLYLAQGAPEISSETNEFLRTAASEVDRVSQIARQILSFHREARQPVEVRICELVRDVMALTTRDAAEKHLQVRTEMDEEAVVYGRPARLRQAFSNIVRNAVEASGDGGELVVRVRRTRMQGIHGDVPAVRVTIADRGAGISEEVRGRIFDAFFTTKEQKGSGVGLWLTSTIIQEHGGRLQVRSSVEPGQSGTMMSVLLPVEHA